MQPKTRHHKLDQAGMVRQIIAIGVVLIVVFVRFNVYQSETNRIAASMPEIRSGIAGYCLDDHHDGTAANAVVDTWPCNGTAAQDWTIGGDVFKHGKTGCLAIQGNGQASGDKVVLNTCDGSPAQAWTVDAGGFQNLQSGLCLAAPANHPRAQLVASNCNDLSQPGQAWAADTWSDKGAADVSCNAGAAGQRVACYAQQQWVAWQSGSPSHRTLLADYTDGNSYEEWCADFVSYVYRQAGVSFTGGERDGWDEYDANNIQNMGLTYHAAAGYTPQPGDIAFFDYPGGHVEIVVKGGSTPTFVYGDSGTTDPSTGNGEMNRDTLTSDGSAGQVVYYLSVD